MALQAFRSQDGVVGEIVDGLDVNGAAAKLVIPSVNIGGQTYSLLSNATATGDPVTGISGGNYIWSVAGTFGGATVKLQYLGPDGSTFIDLPTASLTSTGAFQLQVGSNATVKAVVTGGSPSGLYSSLT